MSQRGQPRVGRAGALRRVRPSSLELGAVALGFVIMAICFAVASRQWFFAEDFQYLGYVRGTFWLQPWTWRDVYLPRLPGFNWAYRPLSFETFYYLGNLAFGLQAFGYLAVSLVFHFASGALLWATALRLGLHRSASAFTALLSVSRLPSLAEIFFISISSYVFSKFWMLASLLLALHALRQERRTVRRAQCAAAAVATALALLSNELALATPAVVGAALVGDGRLRSKRVPWSRIVAQMLPHLLISAAWCVVRFDVIVLDPRPAVYGPSFGLQTVRNAVSLVGSTLGPGASEVLLLWLLVPAAILAARPALRARAGEWPLGAALVGLTWLGAMEAIFAPTLAYQIRFGIAAEVPALLVDRRGSEPRVALCAAASGRRPRRRRNALGRGDVPLPGGVEQLELAARQHGESVRRAGREGPRSGRGNGRAALPRPVDAAPTRRRIFSIPSRTERLCTPCAPSDV